jgi:hypothetical protein
MDYDDEPPRRPFIRVKCPACKQRTGVEIIYGYPSAELGEASNRGDVALGGCVLPDGGNTPTRECTGCGQQWSGDYGRYGRKQKYWEG